MHANITDDFSRDYRIVSKKGEGAFSNVYKCINVKSNKYYACKYLKQKFQPWDNISNLREVYALKTLSQCKHIINLYDVVFEKKDGSVYFILELFDMNLYQWMKLQPNQIKPKLGLKIIYNILSALSFMHRRLLFHRDVKPENILIKNEVAKLADFGSMQSVLKKQPLTEYISTRWYRPPECLLTSGLYNFKMDIWSIGCVTYELLTFKPLFSGNNEIDQISKIHRVFGKSSLYTPCNNKLPHYKVKKTFRIKLKKLLKSALSFKYQPFCDFIAYLCIYDEKSRPTANQALKHPIFVNLQKSMEIENINKFKVQNDIKNCTSQSIDTKTSTYVTLKPKIKSFKNTKFDTKKLILPKL